MFFFSELIQSINCIIISEDVPNISIVLSERRSNFLKGVFLIDDQIFGNFYTNKPTKEKPASWKFEKKNNIFKGEIILFKDEKIWHPYQNTIKSYEVNKVLFYGLNQNLSKISNEINLLKASSSFFKIGKECYGGRINKV